MSARIWRGSRIVDRVSGYCDRLCTGGDRRFEARCSRNARIIKTFRKQFQVTYGLVEPVTARCGFLFSIADLCFPNGAPAVNHVHYPVGVPIAADHRSVVAVLLMSLKEGK